MCASRARQTRLCICDLARRRTVDMIVEYDVHDKKSQLTAQSPAAVKTRAPIDS